VIGTIAELCVARESAACNVHAFLSQHVRSMGLRELLANGERRGARNDRAIQFTRS
jgi:hypothetical protein